MLRRQGDKSELKSYKQTIDDISDVRTQVRDLALQNKNAQATELYFGKVQPELVKAQEYLQQVNNTASGTADQNYKQVMTLVMWIIIGVIALIVCIIAVTVYFATLIMKSLSEPISEMEEVAGKMAQGDCKRQF